MPHTDPETRHGLPLAQWDCARAEMRRELEDCARRGRTITYGDLARRVGAADLTPRSRLFVALLHDACGDELAHGRPMLGSVVVRAGGEGMPGDGFFRFAGEHGLDVSDRRTFWESELERVYACWGGDRADAEDDS